MTIAFWQYYWTLRQVPPFILATICPVDARSRADCNGMFCMDWTTACILWNLSGVSNRRLVRGAWYFFTEYIYNLWSAVYTPFVGINVDWWFSESAPILVMEHSIWLGGPPTKKRTSLLPQVTPYDGALRAAKRAIIAPPPPVNLLQRGNSENEESRTHWAPEISPHLTKGVTRTIPP